MLKTYLEVYLAFNLSQGQELKYKNHIKFNFEILSTELAISWKHGVLSVEHLSTIIGINHDRVRFMKVLEILKATKAVQ